jgi:hypothetical protein
MAQRRLLGDDADGVDGRGADAQRGAQACAEAVVGGPERDQTDARQGDRAAGEQLAGQPLAQRERGEQRDEHRPDVDQQGGGAGVDAPLGGVEQHVVGRREPHHAAHDDAGDPGAPDQRLAAHEHHDTERGAAEHQPRQRQRAGRQPPPGIANADKRRGPQHNGEQCRELSLAVLGGNRWGRVLRCGCGHVLVKRSARRRRERRSERPPTRDRNAHRAAPTTASSHPAARRRADRPCASRIACPDAQLRREAAARPQPAGSAYAAPRFDTPGPLPGSGELCVQR